MRVCVVAKFFKKKILIKIKLRYRFLHFSSLGLRRHELSRRNVNLSRVHHHRKMFTPFS